jgi:hypothetical protein
MHTNKPYREAIAENVWEIGPWIVTENMDCYEARLASDGPVHCYSKSFRVIRNWCNEHTEQDL